MVGKFDEFGTVTERRFTHFVIKKIEYPNGECGFDFRLAASAHRDDLAIFVNAKTAAMISEFRGIQQWLEETLH